MDQTIGPCALAGRCRDLRPRRARTISVSCASFITHRHGSRRQNFGVILQGMTAPVGAPGCAKRPATPSNGTWAMHRLQTTSLKTCRTTGPSEQLDAQLDTQLDTQFGCRAGAPMGPANADQVSRLIAPAGAPGCATRNRSDAVPLHCRCQRPTLLPLHQPTYNRLEDPHGEANERPYPPYRIER